MVQISGVVEFPVVMLKAPDHRCAMSFAVLGLTATERIEIENAEFIATSFPGFTNDMSQLGANMQAWDQQ